MINAINTKLLLLIVTSIAAIAGELAWQHHRQVAIDAQRAMEQQMILKAEQQQVQLQIGVTKALQNNKWK